MKRKILFFLSILMLGLGLTLASAGFNRKATFAESCGGQLNQVQKGFPLPYILVKPSVSNCETVEPISVLWYGNAYHEEYPLGFIADFVFWFGFSALGLYSIRKLRNSYKP